MRSSLSQKELSFISKLELKNKYFFVRSDIRSHFTSDNEMNVYLHRLKKKGRICKINKTKYFLVPVKAVGGNWSEDPFILIDEIMNGQDYCIVGKAAAHYWKLIDQVPFQYEVYSTKKEATITLFHTTIMCKRKRKLPEHITKHRQGHPFIIATKKESNQWI